MLFNFRLERNLWNFATKFRRATQKHFLNSAFARTILSEPPKNVMQNLWQKSGKGWCVVDTFTTMFTRAGTVFKMKHFLLSSRLKSNQTEPEVTSSIHQLTFCVSQLLHRPLKTKFRSQYRWFERGPLAFLISVHRVEGG